jgi:hypothetical protein
VDEDEVVDMVEEDNKLFFLFNEDRLRVLISNLLESIIF